LALLLAGCASLTGPDCEASDSVRVYQAADIDGQLIDFIWVELPNAAAEGTFPGRLFVASADPAGAIVPTMIDLPCDLSSGASAIGYSPAPVEIEIHAAGSFKTSYSWGSCPRCSECYMHWTFSLDLEGHIADGSLAAKVVLNETFHSAPMEIASLQMTEVTQECAEPYMSCRAGGDCSRVRFEPRQ